MGFVLDIVTSEQLIAMMLDATKKLDTAQSVLHQALHAEARYEKEYRIARYKAYEQTQGEKKVDERNAEVDYRCADARFSRDSATAEAKAALESVRSERQKLSALQSISNSVREEAAFSRVGPDTESVADQVTRERFR